MDAAHIVSKFDEELNEIEALLLEMGGLVENQIHRAMSALQNQDVGSADHILALDTRVNELDQEIDDLTVRLLALRQPVATDLRNAVTAMKISSNLERIGDYAKSMARRVDPIQGDGQSFLGSYDSLTRMADVVQSMLKDVLDAYVERDLEKAMTVWGRDDDVDSMYNSIFREILTYMMEDPSNITAGMHLMFVAKNLERTGDHVTNIAEQIHYMITGDQVDEAPANLILFGGRDG